MSHQTREAGNVLFLILIAVVLFAALSYAVSQTTRGGGIDPSDEKAKMLAPEILNYVTAVQTAITRLQISNGCEDTEISFENSVVPSYVNPYSPSNKSCHVFDKLGAGLSWRTFQKDFWEDSKKSSPIFTGQIKIINIGIDKAELSLVMFNIDKSLCKSINRELGINMPSGEPLIDGFSQLPFVGTYNDSTNGRIGDFGSAPYAGKRSFCIDKSGPFSFVHVLIAR
jgi:hypothetical protein